MIKRRYTATSDGYTIVCLDSEGIERSLPKRIRRVHEERTDKVTLTTFRAVGRTFQRFDGALRAVLQDAAIRFTGSRAPRYVARATAPECHIQRRHHLHRLSGWHRA